VFLGRFLIILILILSTSIALGKAPPSPEPPLSENFSETVEDNSILVEEAYNQEPGEVAHFLSFLYIHSSPRQIYLAFSEDWPVIVRAHQLGFTLPFSSISGEGNAIGDFTLSYRYQLFDEKDWAAVSPRLSVIFPTGNAEKGSGFETYGAQINFPVSKRWTNHFITHLNAGMTLLPDAKQLGPSGTIVEGNLIAGNVGVGLGWLANKRFSFLLEYMANFSNKFGNIQKPQSFSDMILNPTLRIGFEVGDVQIVPGLAAPLVWDQGSFRPGGLFYLFIQNRFMKEK